MEFVQYLPTVYNGFYSTLVINSGKSVSLISAYLLLLLLIIYSYLFSTFKNSLLTKVLYRHMKILYYGLQLIISIT